MERTREQFLLPVLRLRDRDGEPCCANDFRVQDGICTFLMLGRFGTTEACYFGGTLFRRKKGEGTLIPVNTCPLWKEK